MKRVAIASVCIGLLLSVGLSRSFGQSTKSEVLTLFGGNDKEEETFVSRILYDEKRENVIIVGWTLEKDFPVTADAAQKTLNGFMDGYIAVFDAECTRLIYSSFIGGKLTDAVIDGAFLDADRLLLGCNTSSPDLPCIGSVLSGVSLGEKDLWFAAISLEDYHITESGYFGGRSRDGLTSMLRLSDGRIAVAGGTISGDLPVTADAFQRTGGSDGNAFIAVLDTSLTLQFCSYHGGRADEDNTFGHITETEHCIVFTGYSGAYNMPVTANAYQPIYKSGGDAFLVAVSKDSMRRVYSTFLGGSYNHDLIQDCIAIGGDRVLIVGSTDSPDFPVTQNAWQSLMGDSTHSPGQYPGDAFIGILNLNNGKMETLTYYGANGMDFAGFVLPDQDGEFADVLIFSDSNNLPLYEPRPTIWLNRQVMLRFNLTSGVPDTAIAIYDIGSSDISSAVRIQNGTLYFTGRDHYNSGYPHYPVRQNGYRTVFSRQSDVFIARIMQENTSVRSIPQSNVPLHIDIAPHPVRSEIRFHMQSTENVTVRVRDLLGRVLSESSHDSDGKNVRGAIGISGIPAGMYSMEATSTSHRWVQQVIVTK